MKRFCRLALTALTLGIVGTLSACGGGGGGSTSTSSSSTAATTTTATEGLWAGTLTSSVTHVAHPVTLLALSSGDMAMFWNTCEQFVSSSSTSSGFFTGSGDAYTSTGTISACPAATFPNGTSLATLTLSGQVTSGSTLIGTYTTGGDSGTYNLTYSAAYARVGTLARLVGTYATSGATLTIDANGTITGSIGTTTLAGTATVIDATKNAYNISLIETVQVDNGTSTTTSTSTTGTTSTTTTTSTTSTTPTTVNVSGVATLIDSGTGSTDNNLLISLTNSTSGFMLSLLKQ